MNANELSGRLPPGAIIITEVCCMTQYVSPSHGEDVRLVNAAETARMVCVSKRTLDRMVARGAFPKPVSVNGRCRWWRHHEVKRFIESLPQYKRGTPCGTPPDAQPPAPGGGQP